MVIGIPTWGDRVSPVLDVAERLVVLHGDGPVGSDARSVSLSGLSPWRRAAAIRESGVEVVICGAISRPLMEALAASGVTVIPWVSGEVNEVLEAYRVGRLQGGRFTMPGCGRARRRAGRRHGRGGGGRRRLGPGGRTR